jgi:hypothetical protein
MGEDGKGKMFDGKGKMEKVKMFDGKDGGDDISIHSPSSIFHSPFLHFPLT